MVRLFKWKRRATKGELLAKQTLTELGGEAAMSADAAARLSAWAKGFYETRSKYTHGGGAKREDMFAAEIGPITFASGSLSRRRSSSIAWTRTLACALADSSKLRSSGSGRSTS